MKILSVDTPRLLLRRDGAGHYPSQGDQLFVQGLSEAEGLSGLEVETGTGPAR